MTGQDALNAVRQGQILVPDDRPGHRFFVIPQSGVLTEPTGDYTSSEFYPWNIPDSVLLSVIGVTNWEVAPT